MSVLHRQDGGRLTLTDNLVTPAAAEGIIGMGMYNATAPTYTDGDVGFFQFTSGGRLKVDTDITVTSLDVEIGSVEIKNATDDTRAVVKSDGTNNALVVTMNSLPEGATVLSTGDNVVGKFKIVDESGTNVADVAGGLLQVRVSDDTAPSITRDTSVDETAAVVIKASGGDMYGYSFDNPNAYDVFVKWYNTAAASVVVGTTAVVRTTRVPAIGSVFVEANKPQQNFTTAVSIACTRLIADNDATAIATDIYAEVYYK